MDAGLDCVCRILWRGLCGWRKREAAVAALSSFPSCCPQSVSVSVACVCLRACLYLYLYRLSFTLTVSLFVFLKSVSDAVCLDAYVAARVCLMRARAHTSRTQARARTQTHTHLNHPKHAHACMGGRHRPRVSRQGLALR